MKRRNGKRQKKGKEIEKDNMKKQDTLNSIARRNGIKDKRLGSVTIKVFRLEGEGAELSAKIGKLVSLRTACV